MYRARLTRPTLKKTECEIVAVKTIKGKDTINFYMYTTGICLPYYVILSQVHFCSIPLQALIKVIFFKH